MNEIEERIDDGPMAGWLGSLLTVRMLFRKSLHIHITPTHQCSMSRHYTYRGRYQGFACLQTHFI
jgi:hypothetical protein